MAVIVMNQNMPNDCKHCFNGDCRYNRKFHNTPNFKNKDCPLKEVPTGKWISVSERLPEESYNSVLGWDAYRERCVLVQYLDGRFQIAGKTESFDIKAWMPLPEPYMMESEDSK